MAVTKLWAVRNRLKAVIDYAMNPEKTVKSNSKYSDADYQSLKDVIAYAKDEEKTEREFFCEGINCNPQTAREQFVTVKEQFGKVDGVQAYHGYISFKEQNITPELAQKIGMEFAQKVWGKRFQVVVTTHLNTKHLHCHFVINSVSFVDGMKLDDKEKNWFKFRHDADLLCEKYGLYYNPKPVLGQSPPRYLTKKEQAGMPTRYNVARAALDEAISMSRNEKELEYELRQMGYSFDFNQKHKHWTITIKGYKKPIRLTQLGEEYSKERIRERLIENRDNVLFEPFQPKTYRPRQYVLLTREHKIRKVGGLYGLYLHYCYKLGTLPKYKKQNPARVHYLLRDDLMKLDELTAQTTLLGKNHIGTTEELFIYKQSVEDEIKSLTAERTHLRNEIRKVNISDEQLSVAKNEISEISDRLKGLRKEVKLCDGIAQRSGEIKEHLEQVIAEEEKQNRKEKSRHEHQR